MHPNAATIERFYEAFARRDTDAMVACYHADIIFSDPVFHELRGARAGAMWRMLAGRSQDLAVEWHDVSATDAAGSALWDARYTFTQTGRKVLNKVHASFVFQDGLIIRHDDSFDLWRWASQALGLRGLLLGWTPFVQIAIHRQAIKALDAYLAAHPA